jgi:hypothetical protein
MVCIGSHHDIPRHCAAIRHGAECIFSFHGSTAFAIHADDGVAKEEVRHEPSPACIFVELRPAGEIWYGSASFEKVDESARVWVDTCAEQKGVDLQSFQRSAMAQAIGDPSVPRPKGRAFHRAFPSFLCLLFWN